ncbi:dienelactone hydrolase [Hymenobacter glaciei]|uniref:Dienelactone hydrolase n=1 Tax=Hymenobacter glaciei TaxID=877209 RepID=A0ABP7TR67_9BACT
MPDFVGCRTLEITDEALGLTFPLLVLYPTSTPSQPETIGLYTLDVALDAPSKPGPLPLVLISHGTGGSPLTHRLLAHSLARQGFVVGLPRHHANHRDDNSWHNTPSNLVARPRHLSLAIDGLFAEFGADLRPDWVALIGHSLGGYTALALAGGLPGSLPHEHSDGTPQPIPTTTDARVRALVLLAPATVWYRAAEALRNVRVPILLMMGEKDEWTPDFHAQIVLNGVADRRQVQLRVIENAGHYSFLSQFPTERVSPAFPPSQDPPGFNRVQFQAELQVEIRDYLLQQLEHPAAM